MAALPQGREVAFDAEAIAVAEEQEAPIDPNNPNGISAAVAKARPTLLLTNNTIYARIANSHDFQHVTLGVIVLNALWIGTDVQWNHAIYKEHRNTDHLPLEPYSTIIENLFCGYFSVELILRFLAYRRKLDCIHDRWFVFDGSLVFFMVLETWILEIINQIMGGGGGGILSKFSALRLLRLLRLTRMARLMKEVPELLTLVKGMMNATKAVSFILMFLVLCMYVFAIVFTSSYGSPDSPEHKYAVAYYDSDSDPTAHELFSSLGSSMMTLFTRGMLADNLAETLEAIKDRGGDIECDVDETDANAVYSSEVCERTGGSLILMWLFITFMIISAFCLLNMLIGVLCEVIQASAEAENENSQMEELRDQMSIAFDKIDTSHDGVITIAEWKQMKEEETVRNSMEILGVEPEHMEERLDQMQESLFGMDALKDADDRPGLTFDQFIEKVIEVRPDAPAGALDIEILRVRVEHEEKFFTSRLDLIEQAIPTIPMPEIYRQKGDRANSKRSASKEKERAANKEPSGPTDSKPTGSAPWFREVPTDVLFAVLNSRAPPELGPPALLVDGSR